MVASFPGSADYAPNSVTATFTITAAVLQVDGLEFQPVGSGNSFTVNNGVYTISSGVQIGFVPAAGQSFVALAELDGNVTIDTNGPHVRRARARSRAVISGTPIPLLTGGLSTTSITSLVNGGLSGLSGDKLTVADTTFTLDSIQLNASGPEIQLQGSIALPSPIGLTVKVNGSNDVDISTSGVSLTGVDASLRAARSPSPARPSTRRSSRSPTPRPARRSRSPGTARSRPASWG